jgi:hypothetical protein
MGEIIFVPDCHHRNKSIQRVVKLQFLSLYSTHLFSQRRKKKKRKKEKRKLLNRRVAAWCQGFCGII